MSNIIKRGKYEYKMKPKSGLQVKIDFIDKEIKRSNSKLLIIFKAHQLLNQLLLVLHNDQQQVVDYLEELILKDLKNEIDPD